MAANTIGWFEIYVQNMSRAKAFYEAVFQTTLEDLPIKGEIQAYSAFPMDDSRYGSGGALVQMTGVPSGPGGTLVYFHCEDCSVEAKRVVEQGGSIFRDKMACGDYGFIAIAFDSEGNMIGLHSKQ